MPGRIPTKEFIAALLLACLIGCSDVYKINKDVNRSFKYIPDKINYTKTPEQFVVDGGGDCEDFANYKRSVLAKKGYKAELVQVPLSFPESHVMVKVNGFLLDNRTDDLRPASGVRVYPFKTYALHRKSPCIGYGWTVTLPLMFIRRS